MQKWYSSKSNITVIIAAIANIVSSVTGIELPSYFNEMVLGLWMFFMRLAVEKSGPVK